MSLITIEQFDELAEDYPELSQCYELNTFINRKDAEEEELIGYTS